MNKNLTNFFEDYLNRESIFKDKKVLQANYTPKEIPHRKEEIQKVATILAPALKKEKPSNVFIYGKTGTGKTLVTNYITNNMLEIAKNKNTALKVFYLNCKMKRVADTEYRLIAEIARNFNQEVPETGLPTNEVYKIFVNALDKEPILLLLILDEIDQLIEKIGDSILYNLTRINPELKNSEISIIGISNNLHFTDYLDARVKSSLCEEEILFPPYNAIQLQSILKERSKESFNEKTIEDGVIEKCAAYAAREHGDARRALELLRIAGELTERKNENKITVSILDEAEQKIEKDKIEESIQVQPKQSQLTLMAIFDLSNESKNKPISTGEVYDLYQNYCNKVKIRPLTQRRISDIIAELDMMGIIHTTVISQGRYGRTRQISLGIPSSIAPKIKMLLKEGLNL
ncbi:MAG: ORC1-type DNA replication protein [Nanoarchaeota archaeon]|nr:ORC1-type DNA replication protein [Nanoarchaeota archaeon]MBU4352163.1 ORC1-type DNA replication protein [Nanoarchaeota archaeon]